MYIRPLCTSAHHDAYNPCKIGRREPQYQRQLVDLDIKSVSESNQIKGHSIPTLNSVTLLPMAVTFPIISCPGTIGYTAPPQPSSAWCRSVAYELITQEFMARIQLITTRTNTAVGDLDFNVMIAESARYVLKRNQFIFLDKPKKKLLDT